MRRGRTSAACGRGPTAESDLAYGIVEQLLRAVDGSVLADYPLLTGDVGRSSPVGVGGQLLGVIGNLQSNGAVVIVIDDVQWTDRSSVEAISFMLRRPSVDLVLIIATLRGERDHLDEVSRRMVLSVEPLPRRLDRVAIGGRGTPGGRPGSRWT